MWPNLPFSADLVTFTEEILNGKLHFLCSGISGMLYFYDVMYYMIIIYCRKHKKIIYLQGPNFFIKWKIADSWLIVYQTLWYILYGGLTAWFNSASSLVEISPNIHYAECTNSADYFYFRAPYFPGQPFLSVSQCNKKILVRSFFVKVYNALQYIKKAPKAFITF